MTQQMNNDEWYALPDKIDMIPDKELQHVMRKLFVLAEGSMQRGWSSSNGQRSLRNCIDFILAKDSSKREVFDDCL